jgi:hypothetical protein
MTSKVFALDTKPGIQRDGTLFDKDFYTDGRWVRFQRGRPRKMAGFRVISDQMKGPSRGMWVYPQDAFNGIFSGYSDGLQELFIDDNGIGSGITDFTLSDFTANPNNLWQFDGFFNVTGGVQDLLAHPGQNLSAIDSTVNTPVLVGDINGSTMSQIGVFTVTGVINSTVNVTFQNTELRIGAGQTVTGANIPASTTVISASSVSTTLSGITVTGTSGTFSCTATDGLFVGQSVTLGGNYSTGTLLNVTVTGTSGTFSCTSGNGLFDGQAVTVSGTLTPTTLTNVQVTGTSGECSCDAVDGIYVGMPVIVSGTLTGTATGIASGVTYYVIGAPTTTTFDLSASPGGSPITTTAGTTTGLVFDAPLQTGIESGRTYFITTTNGSTTFTLSASPSGSALTTVVNSLAGLTFTVPLSIGLTLGQTYYITVTNNSTTFTLSATPGGSAVTTVVNPTTFLTFTLGPYFRVVLSNAATGTGSQTLTFNNNVSVSGGVVSLHPYVFVYGNDGVIRNCSAGDPSDWVSADANEVNVATGKIVKGLPVRGGSNAPSGLFWSLDSLIRVSFSPQTLGVSGTANFGVTNFWRFDIISSQTSILSSQCVIEYDGIYYWIGVDRFLLYNGVVKEIPNPMNQDYFFDNLNYTQRQKVWATKVPRYGEIWWYYPRGDSEECNDAIIYNVRENTWYDAGTALGTRRSAGYFSQVFAFPVAAGWDAQAAETVTTETATVTNGSPFFYLAAYNINVALSQVLSGTNIPSGTTVDSITSSNINALTNLVGGSSYSNGSYTDVPLTGGSGFGATADVTVSGGAVTVVTIVLRGAGYVVGDSLSADDADLGGGGGSGFSIDVDTIFPMGIEMSANATGTGSVTITFSTQDDIIKVYQHEIGVDEIDGQSTFAIESFVETNDLSWVAGGPSQQSPVGENRWLRLERVEPDFILSGDMNLYVTGRPYAQSEDKISEPYVFDQTTNKIDMKEQRREMRLRFESDEAGGNYQMGKVILNATFGDVRGY